MNNKLKEIQHKLYEDLKPSGWADKLKLFLLSDDFYNILETLAKESAEGKKFTPTIKNLFRAFRECPYNELKLVIIGQDPYPKEGAADGIAFSCKHTQHPSQVQASLRQIYSGFDSEFIEHKHTYDLAKWANQGILLINKAFTTTINTTRVHMELWEPFIRYLFEILNEDKGLTFLFLGKDAKQCIEYLDADSHHIYTASHPASAVYNGSKWDTKGAIRQVMDKVYEQTNHTIQW